VVGDKGEAMQSLVPMDGGGVWKRFGVNLWGIGQGRAVKRCDGGVHRLFDDF
jgi:hypothetical protein